MFQLVTRYHLKCSMKEIPCKNLGSSYILLDKIYFKDLSLSLSLNKRISGFELHTHTHSFHVFIGAVMIYRESHAPL